MKTTLRASLDLRKRCSLAANRFDLSVLLWQAVSLTALAPRLLASDAPLTLGKCIEVQP